MEIKYPTFYNSLNHYVKLPDEAYQALEERLIFKKLKEKEYFTEEGKIAHYLPFINKGLMVNYRTDEIGDRHTLQIRPTGWWLGDLYSFFSSEPSFANLICYKPTELLLVSHETFDFITKEYPIFEKYFRIAFQRSYIGALTQMYNLHKTTAEERYKDLINEIPSILDEIPHYLIASYLNIQPQSLSRIRRKLKI
jgi:CRP-like cAMP-binding protein